MNKIFKGLVVILMLGAASPVQAGPVLECSQNAGSNVEIGQCLAGVEVVVDTTVEQVLGYAMAAAKELDEVTGRKVAVPALQAGQTAWQAYRDKHCEFVGSTFGGGSGTGAAIRGCRIELGRERAADLLTYSQ